MSEPQREVALPPRPPWDPKAIGIIAFCFTLLPGAILHTLNEPRLGNAIDIPKRLAIVVLAFLAFITAGWFVPSSPAADFGFVAVNAYVSLELYKTQRGRFKAHIATGGTRASAWLPALLSLGSVLLAGGALIGYALAHDAAAKVFFDAGVAAYERGDYDAAEDGFVRYRDDYNDEDPAAHYNLALTYRELGRYGLARESASRALEIDPTYQEAANLLLEVDALDAR